MTARFFLESTKYARSFFEVARYRAGASQTVPACLLTLHAARRIPLMFVKELFVDRRANLFPQFYLWL